ncbi:keywimysin-related RiPP [Paenarthrobacter sp. NPDC058040]
MTGNTYSAPRIAPVGSFRKVTNGYWFGRWRDIFGGRAFIKVTIG